MHLRFDTIREIRWESVAAALPYNLNYSIVKQLKMSILGVRSSHL